MKTAFILQILIGMTFASEVAAGPVLLASTYVHGGFGGSDPITDQRVAFVLNLVPDFPPYDVSHGLGENIYWANGATGVVDFNAQNDPYFAHFAELATNGVNDFYTHSSMSPDGGGGGGGAPESNWFCPTFPCVGRPPDFFGYQLDFVRLIVDDVDFQRIELKPDIFIDLMYSIRYEFYGTSIPEPNSASMFVIVISPFFFVLGFQDKKRNDQRTH